MPRRTELILAGLALVTTAVAVVLAVLYFVREPDERVVAGKPCGDRIFGHIASLKEADGGFVLRLDPAWFTSGVTANVAAAEDGAVEEGEPVPNDNYVIDESHRLLTYRIAPTARVTVLTSRGDPARFGATPISVRQLAQLVAGEMPVKLFEPLDTGVWIRVHVDAACAIDQQYRP